MFRSTCFVNGKGSIVYPIIKKVSRLATLVVTRPSKMKGKVKILCVCLLAVLLSDISTGLQRKLRPFRFRIRFFNWPKKGCDRKPSIPRLATTRKPKTLPPKTKEPFVLFNPVETNHSSGLPYCKSIDVKAILSAGRRTKREVNTVWVKITFKTLQKLLS